ncbi:putative Rz1-like lipoprotein%2C Qin prophage [Enterobacter hormaechei]|nr:putative Rz1-like lipoprotein%2C Qin prophage [Enterobacter hormaechei]
MLKRKQLPRVMFLPVCLALLASCSNRQENSLPAWTPQSTPQILPLPSEAKQPESTPQCSPTCSEVLQQKLNIMLNDLTKVTEQE